MTQTRLIRFRILALGLTALGLLLATALLLAPPRDVPSAAQIHDKLAHALLFAALPLAALLARLGPWWAIAASFAAYGAVIEVVQPLTGRSFDLADLLANLGGIGLALGLSVILRRVLGLEQARA